ncbi:MAG: TetR/AcrR family transcriptional repressor of nem operon [Paraglaciecola sp.]|jgi:TetR/AcrR family transcriptional repressor of nem operon
MPRTKQFDEAEALDKAKNLFWKQGFYATSVQDLVNHLGINRASIYDTFGGKNQLYEAALAVYQKEGAEYLTKQLSRFDSVKKSLHQLFLEAMQTDMEGDSKGCFLINCATDYLPHNAHILSDLLENKANFQRIVSKTLQRGKDSGEISNQLNIKEISAYLFTFFSGLRMTSKIEKNPQELKKIIEVGLAVLS